VQVYGFWSPPSPGGSEENEMAYRQHIFLHDVKNIEVQKPVTRESEASQVLRLVTDNGDVTFITLRLTDESVAIQPFETIAAAPAPAEETT
jgi:hypothetical protein